MPAYMNRIAYSSTPLHKISILYPEALIPIAYPTLWLEICHFCFVFPEEDRIGNSHGHTTFKEMIFNIWSHSSSEKLEFVIFTWTTVLLKYNVIFLGHCLIKNGDFSLERTDTLFTMGGGHCVAAPVFGMHSLPVFRTVGIWVSR